MKQDSARHADQHGDHDEGRVRQRCFEREPAPDPAKRAQREGVTEVNRKGGIAQKVRSGQAANGGLPLDHDDACNQQGGRQAPAESAPVDMNDVQSLVQGDISDDRRENQTVAKCQRRSWEAFAGVSDQHARHEFEEERIGIGGEHGMFRAEEGSCHHEGAKPGYHSRCPAARAKQEGDAEAGIEEHLEIERPADLEKGESLVLLEGIVMGDEQE